MREYTEFTIPEFLLYCGSLILGLFCIGCLFAGALPERIAFSGALACGFVNWIVAHHAIRKGR